MNLYAYVGGNPINAIDPKGLQTVTCCANGQKKVPIWICRGRLGGDNSKMPIVGAIAHSYIVCQTPKTNPNTPEKFGKHPRPFGQPGNPTVGPGYVNREVNRDPSKAKCRKKMVCPDEKKRMCQEGSTQTPYDTCGGNCHQWATGYNK